MPRGGWTRRLAERTAAVQAALRPSHLQPGSALAAAMGAAVAAVTAVIAATNTQISALWRQQI